MNNTLNIIIVAGGKGLRMGSELPKQFIPIGGKPVLMHTIETFYNLTSDFRIILVLPSSHQKYWQEICTEYKFTIPHIIATGGKTRFHSVKNGLEFVTEGYVGVHDGARPFADLNLISKIYRAAQKYKAVIPVIDPTDSLREIIDIGENKMGKSRIIDRSKIKIVQTPQVFTTEILKKAYEVDFNDSFTDDASVVEASGVDIHLTEGDVQNIKITTPIDLKIGEIILENKLHNS